MAQLIVRRLEEGLVEKLRARAALHGRSSEAEHREILCQALAETEPRRSFKDELLAMPDAGSGADFARSRRRARAARR